MDAEICGHTRELPMIHSCEYSTCDEQPSVELAEEWNARVNQVSWLGEGPVRNSLLITECVLSSLNDW